MAKKGKKSQHYQEELNVEMKQHKANIKAKEEGKLV
jgi:hypothetical protein